ncbi:MAG: iron-sulfur cluster assembly accessory protein [Methanomethylovorans sp.]|jgi:iron-sulfur cluster insertion protein|nr:iron-sulfur cluster assembly accessory protein [Methanomethylovorans sp.]
MVEITEKAAAEIKSLLESENKTDHALRVFVAGMSCCGVQYGMSLDNEFGEDDVTFDSQGIKIVLNKNDVDGLSEATIDYIDSPNGSGFIIENSKTSAGCGPCGGCH